jgi:hypothetical protein
MNHAREALPASVHLPHGTDQAWAQDLKSQVQSVRTIAAARNTLSFERGGRVSDGSAFYSRLSFHSV